MTKSEELAALRSFVDSLPADTYTRTWLAEQLAHLNKAIQCDHPPELHALSITDAMQTARQIIADAHLEAARSTARATKEAEKITAQARQDADQARAYAAPSLPESPNRLTP